MYHMTVSMYHISFVSLWYISYPISYLILSYPISFRPFGEMVWEEGESVLFLVSYSMLYDTSFLWYPFGPMSYPLYPTLSYPILSCPILSYPVLSCPVSCAILSYTSQILWCLLLILSILSFEMCRKKLMNYINAF